MRLPPLRERAEDISDLIRHFFSQAQREGLPPKQIDQAALEQFKRRRWPGNVRELENLARRLAALYPQETITAAVIERSYLRRRRRSKERATRGDNLSGRSSARPRRYFAGLEDGLPSARLLSSGRREIEKPASDGRRLPPRVATNQQQPNLLGVNRNTLRRRSAISIFRCFAVVAEPAYRFRR